MPSASVEDVGIALGGAHGNPLIEAEADSGSWVWIPVDGTVCRDGSSTRIGVRLQEGATGVMLYLQGGGACYDEASCAENGEAAIAGESYDADRLADWVDALGSQGVFNTTHPDNPMAGWNHVYLPYCSGDMHAGAPSDVTITGLAEVQQFQGYANTAAVLGVVAPYFSGAEQVVIAGASAGGFGVLFNYGQVAEAFAPRTVNALVDSAPPLVDPAVDTSCFEQKLLDVLNLRLPVPCPGCSDTAQGGLGNVYVALADTFPSASFGLRTAAAGSRV